MLGGRKEVVLLEMVYRSKVVLRDPVRFCREELRGNKKVSTARRVVIESAVSRN
jgi:hypothetical protein